MSAEESQSLRTLGTPLSVQLIYHSTGCLSGTEENANIQS